MSVRFICDVGSNHNANLGRANELIYQAKEAGCWGVKFQMFDGSLGKPEREWLNPDWLPTLSAQAHHYGLQFGCSVFYENAVDEVKPYVDFYKIASSQVENKPLLEACFQTDKPMIISIPSHQAENCAGFARVATYLYCVPEYPAPLANCHLHYMLRGFGGYSDHTRSPGAIYSAVFQYRASTVEFHLDLEDGQGWEYHFGHCWLPEEIKEVIKNAREGFEAD